MHLRLLVTLFGRVLLPSLCVLFLLILALTVGDAYELLQELLPTLVSQLCFEPLLRLIDCHQLRTVILLDIMSSIGHDKLAALVMRLADRPLIVDRTAMCVNICMRVLLMLPESFLPAGWLLFLVLD